MWHKSIFRTLMAITLAFACPNAASATKYDTSPKPAFLLPSTGTFLILEAFDRVAQHRLQDGEKIQAVTVGRVSCMDVSHDEKLFVVGSGGNSVSVWSLEKGTRLWQIPTCYPYDVRFAANGKSVVACDNCGTVYVVEAHTGKVVARIDKSDTSIMSAVLTPDGSRGVYIDLGTSVFGFDVASGKSEDLNVQGSWPVYCSWDGRFAVFGAWVDKATRLRIVDLKTRTWKDCDVGDFGRIRPAPDGGFLITTRKEWKVSGVHLDPNSLKVKELWPAPKEKGASVRTDFDPVKMVGVSTDGFLRTRVFDLQAGKLIFSIDNTANASYGRGGAGPLIGLAIVIGAVVIAAFLWLRRATRSRSNQTSRIR